MKQTQEFKLINFFPYRARMFYRAVSQTIKSVYAENYQLSPDEWRTLANLHNHAPLTAKEIVIQASINKVNVSRALASLERKALIERHIDPTDRRRVMLRLTGKGRKIMHELIPEILETERRMLACLSEEEYTTLLTLMQKLENNTNFNPEQEI